MKGLPLLDYLLQCVALQIIGVDPYGSILAKPEELNETDVTSYHVSCMDIFQ